MGQHGFLNLTREIDFAAFGEDRFDRDGELAAEFLRNLAAAQEGASTISECRLAASRIACGDTESWFGEWKRIADANNERAQAALRDGHLITARRNWLRATNYYLAATFALEEQDQRYQAAIADMRFCALQFLHLRRPAGEVASVPCAASVSLEGYFLPASDTKRPAPVVVCVGEPQHRKEQLLCKLEGHAAERGLSLFAIDFFDAGAPHGLSSPIAEDPESAIGAVMDYLTSRDDVDPDRIAILADAWGSSFVARAVGIDGRFAAAVCDGGIWELQERAFLYRRSTDGQCDDSLEATLRSSVARALRCPVLITAGAEGWLSPGRVARLVDQLKLDHPDISLKIFGHDETAAAQGHADNPTLANEYIFDWIADRLEAV